MGRYVNGKVTNIVGWTTVAILVSLSLILLVLPIFG
jgi:Mn2+/Fe2+ NRAMP family transporter